MKITFLIYNVFGMGGTVRTVTNTANFLVDRGYDVEIISVRKTSKKPLFYINEKVKIKYLIDARRPSKNTPPLPLYKKIIKKILTKIPSILIDKSEDLYHMFNLFSDIKILFAIKSVKNGILVTTIPSFNILSVKYGNENVIKIGQEHKQFSIYSKNLQNKIKKYYSKLDAITCLSDNETNEYKHLFGNGSVKIVKIENATIIPEYFSNHTNKVIISAGRFVHEKGFDLLIEAFSKVVQKHPEWKLKIFGQGVERSNLLKLIHKYDLANNVLILPKTDNLLKEMAKASIYVLSSRNESFGMVIVEAMSVGLPCVCFACSGPKEIIEDKKDGILVPVGDTNALANEINRLIENKELRMSLGMAARKSVQRYSFEMISQKWDNLIRELKNKSNN
ncbi:glycosyltransferase family 4 protein [Caldibacillus debilis]|uniref:glycosyltransferase family 4 protein n=1 Tax=Caldibacillus debilis TaxID=301148 RepID=UPI000375AD8D|nr:glycosyltransferase family 4 protein [Caldibacillus debilis]